MTFPDKKTIDRVRAEYPPGTIVSLVQMDDPQAPSPGTIGKVIGVDDTASLLVEWQTGSSLNVLYGIDQVKKL
jgi:hypothetical protein